jgi:hypothetical protein
VISVGLARELRDAGLKWVPAAGDRFVVADRGMDSEVFVISDMAIEVHRLPQGTVIGFNGTMEWALDAVRQEDALWLPRESQLRELLAGTFRGLDRVAHGWLVRTEVGGEPAAFEDADVEQAYGLALLNLVNRTT